MELLAAGDGLYSRFRRALFRLKVDVVGMRRDQIEP